MLVWPVDTFPALDIRWRLDHVSASNRALDSTSTFAVTSGGGVWICEMSGIGLLSRAQIMAGRALRNLSDGGATLFEVPSCEYVFAPVSDEVPEGATFGDGATFDDESLFSSSAIDVTLSATAALRATTISVNLTTVGELIGGEAFEIDHPTFGKHRYEICQIDGSDLTIRPPLREEAPADTVLNFDRPACVMRLMNASELFEAIHQNRMSSMTAIFEEAVEDITV